MGGGPGVFVFLIIVTGVIMTFLYIDKRDTLEYDELRKRTEENIIVSIGPSPSSGTPSQVTVGPSPSSSESIVGPSPVNTGDVNSALDSLCEKYPWNNLCKDRPGWTGSKPSEPESPTPVIVEPTAHMAMDADYDGVVNFPEFFNAMSPKMESTVTEDDMFGVFRTLDTDEDGVLSTAEFNNTTGPSPMLINPQTTETIGPSPPTMSSVTFSFCEEYPWNNLCRGVLSDWTGIEPIYPSPDVTGPSPLIGNPSPITTEPIPDTTASSVDTLCEKFPWNNMCEGVIPNWTGVEPIYTPPSSIGPSMESIGPSPRGVLPELDSLCEKYPWNNLCNDRPGWTGVRPEYNESTGESVYEFKTQSEKGYESLYAGDYSNAVINFTGAISIEKRISELSMLYNQRSIAYTRMGEFTSALNDANKIDDANKLMKLERTGDAMYGLELYTDAKNFYGQALSQNPESESLTRKLQLSEQAEQIVANSSTDIDTSSPTYNFDSKKTQQSYERAIALANGEPVNNNSPIEDVEQSAIDMFCATTFWHEMCKDREGWTGQTPDGDVSPIPDTMVIETLCDPETGVAPWLDVCKDQPNWTGIRPTQLDGSDQTDVVSYTDYTQALNNAQNIYVGGQSVYTPDTETETEEVITPSHVWDPQIPLSKWKYTYGIDVTGGSLYDTFVYTPVSRIEATMENCLMKCNEQDHCEGVAFNDTFDRCWGKMRVSDTSKNQNRILYRKTDDTDGISEPWTQALPTPPILKWRYTPGTDVTNAPWEDHTFHYTSETNIKADPETCITKCAEQDNCEGVVFNTENTMCWGMGPASVLRTKSNSLRNLYTKTYESDGMLEPWTQMSITPTVDAEPSITDVEPSKWRFTDGVDVTTPGNTFDYNSETDTKASLETCIRACDDQSYCEGVVFNEDKTMCWGKPNLVNIKNVSNRSIYVKTDDGSGVSEPWNFCSIDDNLIEPECKSFLDEKCKTNDTDPKCVGYEAYNNTQAKRALDALCLENTTDPNCAGYPMYETKKDLDMFCSTNDTNPDCEGYPMYETKKDLDMFCSENLANPKCKGYDGYDMTVSMTGEIDAEILAELCKNSKDANGNTIASADSACRSTGVHGGQCAGAASGGKCFGDACCSTSNWCWSRTGGPLSQWCETRKSDGTYVGISDGKYDGTASRDEADKIARRPSDFSTILATRILARKALDDKCATNDTNPDCAGYESYNNAQAKRDLDDKCATNTTDPDCADYPIYKAKRVLDELCLENTTDPKCAGYPMYENKKALDMFCSTNDTNPDCEGYPMYENKKALDDKCATDTVDSNCAGYEAYDDAQAKRALDMFCPENLAEPKCSGYDGHLDAYCEENLWDPKCKGYDGYDMAVSITDEIDAEILAELCKNSKDADGNTIASADSACRSTGGQCAGAASGGKCGGDACCSNANWCSSRTGGPWSQWCRVKKSDGVYIGKDNGRYDGTASRDEADKIARRPSDFSTILATRILARTELNEFCARDGNLADPKCEEFDGHLDARCLENTTDSECADYPVYKAKRALDAGCLGNLLADPKCSEYVGHLDAFCARDGNLADPKCEEFDGHLYALCARDSNLVDPKCEGFDIARSAIINEIDAEILADLCKNSKDEDGSFGWYADRACRMIASEWNPYNEGVNNRCGVSGPVRRKINGKWLTTTVSFGGSKCPADQCCSESNYCGKNTETGLSTLTNESIDYCTTWVGKDNTNVGRDIGKYDGTASRDEADKIARRPANFTEIVASRL